MLLVSCALAAVAAAVFAVSATLQQTSARRARLRVAAPGAPPPGVVRRWLPIVGDLAVLARDPLWLAGWGLNIIGFGFHAVALHLGSIGVVQAILVVQLLVALVLSAAVRRRRLTALDWLGTTAVCAGVAMVIVGRGTVPQLVPSAGRVLITVAVAATVVGVLLVIARRAAGPSQVRSALVAVGAGTCFCVTAVFVVLLTDLLSRHGLTPQLLAPLCGLVGSVAVGSLMVQDSFASGSLPTALTAMTITDPVASYCAGFILFDAVAVPGGVRLVELIAGGILIAVGVVTLANSTTLALDAPTPVIEPVTPVRL